MAVTNEIVQQQIVRVHTDSAQDLDKLFRVVISKEQQLNSKPMRLRNLPASFFTPPETGTKSASHSRESSIDQQAKPYFKPIIKTNTASTNQLENKHIIINQHPKLTLLNRSIPIHSRAHSSPATLQKTLSVVPQQLNQNNQNAINQQVNAQPNVQNVQTTVQQQQQQQPQPPQQQQQTVHSDRLAQQQQNTAIQHIRQLSDISQIPLPKGWQEAVCHTTGRTYFINHNEKTTTWDDPRFVNQQQQLRILQLQQQLEQQKQQQIQAQLQQQIQLFQNQQHQTQQQIIQSQPNQQQIIIQQPPPQTITTTANNIVMTNTKLPDDWEQRKTEEGEIYYINHTDCTSTWFDPRIPLQLQKQNANRPPPVDLQQVQQQIQQIQLSQSPQTQQQQLTNGDHNLIQQQQNIIQQQQTIQSNNIQTHQQSQANQQTIQQQPAQQIIIQQQPPAQQSIQNDDYQMRLQKLQFERDNLRQRQLEIQNQINTGMDPFLGGTLIAGENHSRQESADSGLGLGSNYSLPNTPDDMLENDIDLNECNEFGHGELGMNSLVLSTMDLDENMDNDLLNMTDDCQEINLNDLEWIS